MATILTALAVVVLALYGVAVLITLIELWRAPQGYEDERGFHVMDGPGHGGHVSESDHPAPGFPA